MKPVEPKNLENMWGQGEQEKQRTRGYEQGVSAKQKGQENMGKQRNQWNQWNQRNETKQRNLETSCNEKEPREL